MMKRLYITLSLLLGLLIPLTVVANSSADSFRIVSEHDTHSLWLKDGATNAPWQILVDNANNIGVLAPTTNRIAYIDGNDDLYVKEGSTTAPWQLVAHNIINAKLEGNEIVAITGDLTLMAKTGALSAPWVTLRSNVYDVAVSSNRILAVSDYDGSNANIVLKEGGLYGAWVTEAVTSANDGQGPSLPTISVTDTRLAYSSGDYLTTGVKDGSATGPWNYAIWGNSDFGIGLAGDRICLNTGSPDLSTIQVYCKDALNAGWVLVSDDGLLTDMRSDKIAVINLGNEYPTDSSIVLDGSLAHNSGWQVVDTGLLQFNSQN